MPLKKYLIVLGPPGSGKGTQAKILSQKYGFFYFGTGDLMREAAEKGTEIGKRFQEVWNRGKGELVPDDLVDEFVNYKIQEINFSRGIIFDGYPRTIKQADNLAKILQIDPKDLYLINIEVSEDLLVKRIQTRKVCQKCDKVFFRPDENGIKKCDSCGGGLIQRQEDKPETMKKRIEVYKNQTQPLIDYYKDKGTIINIDGNPPIIEVGREIDQKLNRILNEN